MGNTVTDNTAKFPKTASEFRDLLMKNEKPGTDGKLSARERIVNLFDEGTFTEIGAYTMRRISEFDSGAPDEFESVICGYGAVNGCLVYAFSQDFGRRKGSISEAAAKKICEVYRLALENGCPVVGIFDSAGAYLPEGVRALGAYGKIMQAVSKASGVIPQVALVPGIAEGAAAIVVSMFDFIIATENSQISVNPPFIVGGGTTEDSVEAGIVSFTAPTDMRAIFAVRTILTYLPSNNQEGVLELETDDTVNRPSDISQYIATREIRALIAAISDNGKFIELGTEFEKGMFSGLITIGGTVCGVIGTDHCEDNGRLTSKGSREAARFISFCDCFNIPIITLVDSEGFAILGDEEKNPYCAEIGKLALSYSIAKVPLITLIAGAAYGSVFSILGSKSIGADVVLALDTAKVSCMNPRSAVALLWNDKINDLVTRESLEALWEEKESNIIEAAKAGEIDDIVSGAELRQRIASAVFMLSGKAKGDPRRRHVHMPL